MTKEELNKYYYLKKEMSCIEHGIIELQTHLTHITQVLSDMPKGQADSEKKERILDELDRRRIAYLDVLKSAEIEKNNILRYISGINDPLVRLIIHYRYIDLFSWSKVASLVGGNNTPDSVRMLSERYIKKN